MAAWLRSVWDVTKRTVGEFGDDECQRMAAALSYYTVFSLPPLLVLILLLAGSVLDPARVQQAMETQVGGVIGTTGAQQIRTILEHSRLPGSGGPIATVIGIVTLLLGATGAFIELQSDLNRTWEVKPDPRQGGLRQYLMQRVFSFGMILAVAFLLLVSLVVSALLVACSSLIEHYLPSGSALLLQAVNFLISLVVITVLFGAIFKFVPDAKIEWPGALVGGLFTAILFTIGKFLIGLYLGKTNPGSAFGAAGSLALVFVWIYYSASILFLGAEFTQVWAEMHGKPIQPKKGAVQVVQREQEIRGQERPEAHPAT